MNRMTFKAGDVINYRIRPSDDRYAGQYVRELPSLDAVVVRDSEGFDLPLSRRDIVMAGPIATGTQGKLKLPLHGVRPELADEPCGKCGEFFSEDQERRPFYGQGGMSLIHANCSPTDRSEEE